MRYQAACGALHLKHARKVFNDAGLHDERDFELLRHLMVADGYEQSERWANDRNAEPTVAWWPHLASVVMRESVEQVTERLGRLGKAGVVTRAGPKCHRAGARAAQDAAEQHGDFVMKNIFAQGVDNPDGILQTALATGGKAHNMEGFQNGTA